MAPPINPGMHGSGASGEDGLAMLLALPVLVLLALGAIELACYCERIGERYENIKRATRGEVPFISEAWNSPTAIAWFMFKRWLLRKLGS